VSLLFFLAVAAVVSVIDWRSQLIPDNIILPSILLLMVIKYMESALRIYDIAAMGVTALLFALFIFFHMRLGGGDIRYGVFCTLFVGWEQLGWFIMAAGLFHLLLMAVTHRREGAFAPAMSLGALLAYGAAL
jgi:leader peptidase (prepilin peptidase) / N-methyltransferase